MKKNKELIESLNNIIKSNILHDNVVSLLYSVIGKIKRNDELNEELEKQKEFSCEMLKLMIGRPIYWANPYWRHETHIITDVRYEIFDSDFFDTKETKYKGKKCIIIEVEDSGRYLAVDIGRTLFFNEEEAIQHSKYGVQEEK